MTLVVGIDPGKSGAIFLYDPVAGLHECAGVPLLDIKVNGKTKTQPDYGMWLMQWGPVFRLSDHVFVEQVGAMPGQGVTSMFSFGYTAGFALGLLMGYSKPYTFLTPQKWKKIVGLSGSDGDESRKRASQLMPEAAHFWPLKKDDGKAEAALIAYAGYRILTGTTGDLNAEQTDGRRHRSPPKGAGEAQGKPKRRRTRTGTRGKRHVGDGERSEGPGPDSGHSAE